MQTCKEAGILGESSKCEGCGMREVRHKNMEDCLAEAKAYFQRNREESKVSRGACS